MKVEKVKELGKALLVSRENVNNCSTLLSFIARDAPLECVLEAVRCLQAFFLPVLASEGLKPLVNSETAEGIYRAWLNAKYEEFTQILNDFVISSKETRLQSAALDALMELLRAGDGKLNYKIYFKLCSALAEAEQVGENVADALAGEYCKEADVCLITVSNFAKLVASRLRKGNSASETFIQNVYFLISRLSPAIQDVVKTEKSKSESAKTSKATSEKEVDTKRLRKEVKKLWFHFLQLPLPLDIYKKVLADISHVVFPVLPSPVRLSDFLIKSYDIGGIYSVLALDGLYILMTKHGLEYPEFYDKLYALLEPSIFFTKHRPRFFELLDSCLKSPLLSSYLAAAFAKKLSRMALSASPAGALVVIAMVHNLLRRHPSINCLVHQKSKPIVESEDGENPAADSNAAGKDPFLARETKTSNCCALESSLWEIESLRKHYCPAVSRFVSSLENDLTVRAKTTEVQISDFSSGSYSTIFREETKRRLKQVPLAYYQVVPKTLFDSSSEDFAGWSFESQEPEDEQSAENDGSNKRQRVA